MPGIINSFYNYSFYDKEDFQLFIKVQFSLFVILGVIDPLFYFLFLQI